MRRFVRNLHQPASVGVPGQRDLEDLFRSRIILSVRSLQLPVEHDHLPIWMSKRCLQDLHTCHLYREGLRVRHAHRWVQRNPHMRYVYAVSELILRHVREMPMRAQHLLVTRLPMWHGQQRLRRIAFLRLMLPNAIRELEQLPGLHQYVRSNRHAEPIDDDVYMLVRLLQQQHNDADSKLHQKYQRHFVRWNKSVPEWRLYMLGKQLLVADKHVRHRYGICYYADSQVQGIGHRLDPDSDMQR